MAASITEEQLRIALSSYVAQESLRASVEPYINDLIRKQIGTTEQLQQFEQRVNQIQAEMVTMNSELREHINKVQKAFHDAHTAVNQTKEEYFVLNCKQA